MCETRASLPACGAPPGSPASVLERVGVELSDATVLLLFQEVQAPRCLPLGPLGPLGALGPLGLHLHGLQGPRGGAMCEQDYVEYEGEVSPPHQQHLLQQSQLRPGAAGPSRTPSPAACPQQPLSQDEDLDGDQEGEDDRRVKSG